MKSCRMNAALTCAVLASLLMGSSLSGQHAGHVTGKSIVVEGCINRAQQDGSLAGSPGVPPASTSTAPQLANSSEPTNTFLLNGATAPEPNVKPDAAGAAPAITHSYVLDGTREELERHLGHHVEVTGTLTIVSESAEPEARNQVQRVKVAGIRMLSAACPASPTEKK
jgi:hypothetical protein